MPTLKAGYSFRSRCDLLSNGTLSVEVIDVDGSIETVPMTVEKAVELFGEAEKGLARAGISVRQRVVAKPSRKLVGLIAANKAVAAVSNGAGDE